MVKVEEERRREGRTCGEGGGRREGEKGGHVVKVEGGGKERRKNMW